MKLKIQFAPGQENEKKYIAQTLLGDFLGLSFEIHFDGGRGEVRITSSESSQALILPDVFFASLTQNWLKKESLPQEPLLRTRFGEFQDVPVIFGTQKNAVWFDLENGYCGLDVFGSAFFMLSRYEEYVEQERDSIGRFPLKASLAFRENFFERPVINEYLEILWMFLTKLEKGLVRKKRHFEIKPTHDIDAAFLYYRRGFGIFVRGVVGRLRTGKFKDMISFIKNYIWVNLAGPQKDSFNSYSYIMDQVEKRKLQSTFYFIYGRSNRSFDGNYDIDEPCILQIQQDIIKRGHLLGMHPSFETFKDPRQFSLEATRLRSVLTRIGGDFAVHSRQHYLRWEFPSTLYCLTEVGAATDSTLGYAERPGFRCGVCYSFNLYDLVSRRESDILEQPMVLMETSLLESKYLGFTTSEQVHEKILSIKKTVRRFNGEFNFLWHNSRLFNSEDRRSFEFCLEAEF